MKKPIFQESLSPSNLRRFFRNDDENEKLKRQAEAIDNLARDPNLEDYVELSDTDPGEDDEDEDVEDEDENQENEKRKGKKRWGFLG